MNFFSNFHVTKVKEFISFITKINKNSIEQARSGRIGKYVIPTSFWMLFMIFNTEPRGGNSSKTNNDNFFQNIAAKDFSFILSFL